MSPAADENTPAEQDNTAEPDNTTERVQETAADQAPDSTDQAPDSTAEPEQDVAAEETGEVAAGEADSSGQAAEPGAAKPAKAKAPRTRTTRSAAAKSAREPAVAKAAPVAAFSAVEADLPAGIFDAKVNVPLIHQVVIAQQAAARQGTHATKTRGEVRGGGRKPYRQKGTGRARQGSTRAPQFTGGGVVHGPVPRSYDQRTPKKMKAAALRGALSDRARHGMVHVVEGFVSGGEPKTRNALATLAGVTGSAASSASVLVVADRADQVTWKSLRNAPGVHLIDPGQLNTYDVLVNDRVVFTADALASFVARAGRTGGAEGEER